MSDPEEATAPAQGAQEASAAPAVKQRPKMTLEQQSAFLLNLLGRCVMHSGERAGQFAGTAMVTLTEDDMLRLEAIQQTLAIFDMHDAARLVKDEMWRKKNGKGKAR